jgi:hypothetical protein
MGFCACCHALPASRPNPKEKSNDPPICAGILWPDVAKLCQFANQCVLRTCAPAQMPAYLKSVLSKIHDPRIVESRPLTIENAALREKLGMHRFASATFRLFKLDGLEPACENYGQAVIYKGTVEHPEEAFVLDGHHVIERGKTFAVFGNTCAMLQESRFAPHFEFIGDFSTYFRMFEGCGTEVPMDFGDAEGSPGACC